MGVLSKNYSTSISAPSFSSLLESPRSQGHSVAGISGLSRDSNSYANRRACLKLEKMGVFLAVFPTEQIDRVSSLVPFRTAHRQQILLKRRFGELAEAFRVCWATDTVAFSEQLHESPP